MKVHGTLIQGALALFGLGAAYSTWQREPEKAAGEVVVLEASKADIVRVRYEDDKGWAEVWREHDADKATWVKVSARDATTPGGQKTPERELRGNEAAGRVLDLVAPLKATRSLGVVAADKLKEYGLAPPDPPAARDGGAPPPAPPPYKKKTITITARGGPRTFTAGTPPGLFATYLRDEADGRVYLLTGTMVSDLEGAASRMIDRTLHAFKPSDYDALKIEAGGKTRELVALPGDSAFNNKLAGRKSPDKPDETAKNWHDKLFRVFPSDVLGKGEKPAGGDPQILLKVAYTLKGQDKGFIEVGKVTPPPPPPPPPAASESAPPPPAPPPAPLEYWARTEHSAGWVKLGHGADDIAKEADKIAAAE